MWEILYSKNHAEIEAGELLVPGLLFFKIALFEVKASGQHFSFNIF